jgi:hypothetical protein
VTDPYVVPGTVMSGTCVDGSNTGAGYARLRAFAVTLGLGPIVALPLALALPAGQWPAAGWAAYTAVVVAAGRASRVQFLWARLD